MPRSIFAHGCSPRRLLLAGLVGAGWLAAAPAARAQLPDATAPKNVPGVNDAPDLPNGPNGLAADPAPDPTAAWPRMTLGECIAIALERQPALKAAQHSLRSTEIGYQALYNLPRIAGRVQPDLPCRKQQAARGITLATAAVQQTYHETVYDVTRLYFTYVYARQQETTARNIVTQMEVYYKVAEEILKSGVRDPKIKTTQFTLYTLRDVIHEVQRGQARAATGKQAALAALREAMGVDDCFLFVPADTELPVMSGTTTCEQVLGLALARRPELTQAAAGLDAFRIEVKAQAAQDGLLAFKAPTLASGSDIHARPVPAPHRNGDYRPGAVAPEMPPNLVGRVEDRVARATALADRQEAVYEKAVGLVRLEATNAFLNYQATARAMEVAKGRYETGQKLVEQARQAAGLQQDAELLVRNEALAGKAQSEYVEAVFEHIKALATLERVTAGAIRPAFPGR